MNGSIAHQNHHAFVLAQTMKEERRKIWPEKYYNVIEIIEKRINEEEEKHEKTNLHKDVFELWLKREFAYVINCLKKVVHSLFWRSVCVMFKCGYIEIHVYT